MFLSKPKFGMFLRLPLLLVSTLVFVAFSTCNPGPSALKDILKSPVEVTLNPHGRVPLGAVLQVRTEQPCQLTVTVPGETPVKLEFLDYLNFREVPVLGLYPGRENVLKITLTTEDKQEYSGTAVVATNALPTGFPTIDVTTLQPDKMEAGFHLVDLLLANNGKFLPYTVMFDNQGVIRWFMDMSEQEQITYTTYRLKNGNWLYLNWIKLLEVNDLGKTIREEQMRGNAGKHEIIEMPNGMLLMGGSKKGSYVMSEGRKVPTRFDHAIIWDRMTNRTAKEWDMRKYFKVDRHIFPTDYGMDPATDWFHVNSIAISSRDNSVLVSGSKQGVAKVGPDNSLRWVLAPHVAWGQAGFDGKGLNTTDYLLAATNATGELYPDEVQQGKVSAEDFDWPTGQHALNLLPNGNLLLFDNGLRRNFESKPTYSRAVEYKIDEANRTITQVWQYGKERGLDMFSPTTSDVDALPNGNRLITSGNIQVGGKPGHGKMVEVTYPNNEVVFEADIYFKNALDTDEKRGRQSDLLFRGERYSLTTNN
jgi:arylsulfate sulfotransferase